VNTSDTPRKTFSAPPRYWDVLDQVIIEGHAKTQSDAFRFVIDSYQRNRHQQALTESAGRLNDDDWMILSGFDQNTGNEQATPWSQLATDQQD
jgi:hypothetical protein